MTNFTKRVWTEYNKLKGLSTNSASTIKFILDSSPFDNDVTEPTNFNFTGRILPMSEPFNQSAFRVEIKLTNQYPGKPPDVQLLTKIHHPNVFEDGSICLPILNVADSWNPSIYLSEVLKALVEVIDHPDLNIPVNDDVANEYLYRKDEFDRKALQMVQKNKLARS